MRITFPHAIAALAAIGMLLVCGRPVDAEPNTVDLMPLIDVQRDAVGGKWAMDRGGLVSDRSWCARLRIPYEPPEEYDFHIEFVRETGENDVVQMFRYFGRTSMWVMGAWGNTTCGFSTIDGYDPSNANNPTAVRGTNVLRNGQKYNAVVEVRRGSVAAYVDGNLVSKCIFDPSRFGITGPYSVGSNGLGVGSWGSRVRFDVIEVVEISGTGTSLPRNPGIAGGGGDKKPEPPADTPEPTTTLHIDAAPDTSALPGPSTRPAVAQSSINALEIYQCDNGMMLGQTSEATLTLTKSDTPQMVAVRFVTKVGDQMCLARDDALRFIHLKYPNWNISNAEITFEDKYVAHDGGSIGAAIGTMILSCIQGFNIDSDAAITGDISANGKVRAIGGVSAKIKGATANKCTLVAIPADNLDQLTDAVIYNGPELVSDIQVIGITNLDDAIATVRTDRDPKLSQAITLFAAVQKSLKARPASLHGKDVQDTLHQVLALAPNHLSAQVLLDIAEGKQPKTLSATASQYYTYLAVNNMADVLKARSDAGAPSSVPSSVVRTGLTSLRKLRPIADENVRPLIDAWASFLSAWNEMQEGLATPDSVESRRQVVIDEMAKENADADLMQKMLREGM